MNPLLAAALALASAAYSSDARELRVTRVEGTVYLHLHDHPEGDFIPAEEGTPMEEGDHVRTGTDGTAELAIDGDSVIELAPNSDFIVNSLAAQRTEFHLGIGSFMAKIKTLLKGRRMEFHTQTAVAAVRGTELAVSQEEDQPTRVGVFDEGHVSVRTQGQRKEVAVGPGEETSISRGQPPAVAGPLKAMLAHRQRFEGVRRRAGQIAAAWVPRSMNQRTNARKQYLSRPRVAAKALQNVRESRRFENYSRLKARRSEVRHEMRRRQRTGQQAPRSGRRNNPGAPRRFPQPERRGTAQPRQHGRPGPKKR